MSVGLVLAAAALAAASGLVRRERVANAFLVLGAVIGFVGACLGFGAPSEVSFGWSPPIEALHFGIDGLSSWFLLQLFVLSAVGSIYGLGYWPEAEQPGSAARLRLFWGLLTGGVAVLLVARDPFVFLLGWEVMALSAFFCITADDREPTVRQAGLLYLICTRVGTLALIALFLYMRLETGSWRFDPREGAPWAAFGLALIGFGTKAGVVPLHFWLPSAHGSAPSHVSSLMSGMLIKTGIYGFVRIFSLYPDAPVAWGRVVLALGAISAVAGVAWAIGQHDIKRLLAYHSIENIGIILLGLGLGLIGRALHRDDLLVLGLAGALLHTWNHGLFKSLLFLSAGSVLHATGERDADHLGGLARRMPATSLAFLVGAVAICGLPPLNGFVSEFLVYLGLIASVRGGGDWLFGGLAAPALALTGALAMLCFAKVFGAVFLGEPRTVPKKVAHDPGPVMIVPMAVLAALCLAIGLYPMFFAAPLDSAIAAWGPRSPLLGFAPLGAVSVMALLLALTVTVGAIVLRLRLGAAPVADTVTWDCGYARPTPRMQYTASSFADTILGLFAAAMVPVRHVPELPRGELFPHPARYHGDLPDLVFDRAVLPAARLVGVAFTSVRSLQRGSARVSMLLILVAIITLYLVFCEMPVTDLLFHLLIALSVPPLLLGVINRTKAIVAGRRGQPVLQLYFDLWKLWQKGSVFSTTTTWVFRAGPVVGLATVFVASLLLPLGWPGAPLGFAGDLVLFAYLLGLGRFFTVAAALDTGSAFEGMGASREATFACLAEPALFLCLLALVRQTGETSLGMMLGSQGPGVWGTAGAPLALIAIAAFLVLLVENCRIPFDDPNTHLELTMIHEVMVLDHSGPALAMILYGAALKLFLFAALVVRIVLPFSGDGLFDQVAFFGAMFTVAVLVGLVESTTARLRLLQVPRMLVSAVLLAAFGLILVAR